MYANHPEEIGAHHRALKQDHCSLYLVMELCEGGELFDRLVEEKHLTEPVVKKVMKQASELSNTV